MKLTNLQKIIYSTEKQNRALNVTAIVKILRYPFQGGNLVGLCQMEELCPTMTPKRMPGKAAKAALKYQFVKSKVGIIHFILCVMFPGANV